MRPPLFDAPWHKDWFLRTFLSILVLSTLISSVRNIQPGAHFNPDRARHLLGDVTIALVLAFVVVALLPALVRQRVRTVRAAQKAEAAAAEAAIAPPSLRFGPRAGWTDAPTFRNAIGKTGPDGELLGNDNRPPDLFLELDSQLTIPSVPVRLTWQAPGAEVDFISGLPGEHPPSGAADVTLPSTCDITVVASNAYGSRTERTALVRVVPMPTMTRLALPPPPSMMLGATIDVSLNWGEPVLSRLDAVLGEHERQRLARIPQLPEHLTMAQITSSIRNPMAELLGWRPAGLPWLTRSEGEPENRPPSALQAAVNRLTDQARTTWAAFRSRAARPEPPAPDFQPGVVAPLPVHGNVNVVAAPARGSSPYDSLPYDQVTAKNGGWTQTSHDESRM